MFWFLKFGKKFLSVAIFIYSFICVKYGLEYRWFARKRPPVEPEIWHSDKSSLATNSFHKSFSIPPEYIKSRGLLMFPGDMVAWNSGMKWVKNQLMKQEKYRDEIANLWSPTLYNRLHFIIDVLFPESIYSSLNGTSYSFQNFSFLNIYISFHQSFSM